MDYPEQLNQPEWKEKRLSILRRDGHRCQICFNRSLIDRYRISLHGASPISNNLIYIIFDKEVSGTYRCRTDHEKSFLFELLQISQGNSIVALTSGTRDFCQLIATVVLPKKLDYSSISGSPDEIALKQEIQEDYLKYISKDKLTALRWLDTKSLHIHHRYYQIGKMAWEYPDSALTTLCWECHEKLHADTEIDVLDDSGEIIGKRQVCTRCHGAGRFPEYSHVEGGACFRCGGERFE
ncbi:hypothetical protein [Pontibacter chinhatensis]|uniref:Uncharacterized protein n=1 Tax=Pontibacter chinhatensis TaxID=1436961 RepID=A0A1I2ZNB5_9BACT|nr:hypothetical protein [Pontibacter chinhatensis]SFH39327.1 hypothetical protein SAMN05421739_11630 [Pontibacter chinhatensis]